MIVADSPDVFDAHRVAPRDDTYELNDVGIEWHCIPFDADTRFDVPMNAVPVDTFHKVALHSPGGTTSAGTVLLLATVTCPIT